MGRYVQFAQASRATALHFRLWMIQLPKTSAGPMSIHDAPSTGISGYFDELAAKKFIDLCRVPLDDNLTVAPCPNISKFDHRQAFTSALCGW